MTKLRRALTRIMRLQQRGDFLQAYDLSMRVHRSFPESTGAKFNAVLALAHYGLIDKAWKLYGPEGWDLDATDPADLAALAGTLSLYRARREALELQRQELRSDEPQSPPRSQISRAAELFPRAYEDLASIGACLAREQTWRTPPTDRTRFARRAANLFVKVFEETEGILPGINAAAMYLLAGDPNTASFMARRVLSQPSDRGARAADHTSQRYVALAIGYLMSDELVEFAAAMKQVVAHWSVRLVEAGSSWRQIHFIGEQIISNIKATALKEDGPAKQMALAKAQKYRQALASFRAPSIIQYGGHMISVEGAPSRFLYADIPQVRRKIDKYLEQHQVGAGYGGLACGADILFAERLLKHRAELHVIIPFRTDEFIDTSVRRGGKDWLRRFDACLRRATSVTQVTEDECLGDPGLFALGSEVAMGMAVLRQHATTLPLRQVLVWDGQPNQGRAGTYWMRQRWESLFPGTSDHIGCGSNKQTAGNTRAAAPGQGTGREVKALLFGDVKGFSKLKEELVPKFWEVVIGGLTETLERFQKQTQSVSYWNTWGDAIFVVIDSVAHGAECALRLQERIQRTNFAAAGLPADMSMRFGMHVGAVYRSKDPVTKAKTWYGSQVSRAARIEPVAQPGEIYVSEPFACVLALEALEDYDCEYVGRQQAAKAYGAFRMYRLRRRPNEAEFHQEL